MGGREGLGEALGEGKGGRWKFGRVGVWRRDGGGLGFYGNEWSERTSI